MKILYFYPDNPLLRSQGNHARALALLNYFKDRNIKIDLVSECSSTEKALANEQDIKKLNLAENHYFIKKFDRKKYPLNYFFTISLPNKLFRRVKYFNRIRIGQMNDFNAILKNNSYDYIIISYACWAPLIQNNINLKNAKLVIDTHDFLTAQFKEFKDFNLGRFFETEINLLKLFDLIITISSEEKYLFSQFTDKKVTIVPHSLPNKFTNSNFEKNYDIIYVASDNEHNIKGAAWFFDQVYHRLPSSIKILVIGGISKTVKNYPNVKKIAFAEDLNPYYVDSKIAICPMFSGTGLKIKVIEALSYGLPVICNEKGVDGMINKIDNGCLTTNDTNQFANYINNLLTDKTQHSHFSSLAKKYFLNNHDCQKVYANIDSLLDLQHSPSSSHENTNDGFKHEVQQR
jgi:glycosyltransferase involved in cell wall biosynthesis